ncbi:MAG: hypothetical protein AAF633_10520 [Chloroflexota bacterium]
MNSQVQQIRRFALFGATGRSGLPLIEQGLAAGYEINAFLRSPGKLTISDPRLHPIQGDDLGIRLTRADLAAFILNELDSNNWVHQAPVVSN